MFKGEYEVIATGHRHAGKPLAVGDILTLPAVTADRFPAVFKRHRSTTPTAERVTRSSKSARSATPDTSEE